MVQVFVRTVDGETRVVDAPATVAELRCVLAEWEGVEPSELRVATAGRDLADGEDLCVPGDATLFSHLRLLGGGKKRKKKVYTKPKKIKHKKTKVPKAVLKFYKVNDDGTIDRLRRECPSETCGAGTFMAEHKDRRHCGKCGRTYVKEE